MSEEQKGLVKYTSRDGQEITLSFEIVRQYLVSGKKELLTPNELMYFLGVCKSRGLNPFKKDAYLIKYSQDPAAIVTSIDFYRSRARAQKDCRGWRKGVIVLAKPQGIVEREGTLVLEGEKLIGGWFEAKPDGWDFPLHHTVNLKGYIKKKIDGSITRFWEEDNQPSQIMKVAESQGLRMAWPDEFQQLYSEEEILAPIQDPDSGMSAAAEAERKTQEEAVNRFKEKFPEPGQISTFLQKTAEANRWTIDEVMARAGKDTETLESFSTQFQKWLTAQKKEEAKQEEGKVSPPNAVPGIPNPPPSPERQTAEPLPPPPGELSPIEKVKKLERDEPQIYSYIAKSLGTDGCASEALALMFLKEVDELRKQGNQTGMGFNKERKRYEARK